MNSKQDIEMVLKVLKATQQLFESPADHKEEEILHLLNALQWRVQQLLSLDGSNEIVM